MPHSPTSALYNHPYNGNPWSDNDGNASTNDQETEEATQCTPKAHPMHSHPRFYTAGHPLYTPDNADGQDCEDFARRTSLDSAETRQLRRDETTKGSASGEEELNSRTEEKEVIVHQVTPMDSLAGVALKYNVTIATLRAANKLWATDSIHLRQVLYIPLDAVSATSPQSSTNAFQHSPSRSCELHLLSNQLKKARRAVWEADSDEYTKFHSTSALDTATIRRIPISELSFFPPSTHATQSSKSSRSPSRPEIPETTTGLSAPSFPGSSLASLLNGAKDEIMSRLSFDSARDSSEIGGDEILELEIVRRKDRRSRAESNDTIRLPGTYNKTDVVPEQPVTPKILRTVQLQPSPSMVIPTPLVAVDRP